MKYFKRKKTCFFTSLTHTHTILPFLFDDLFIIMGLSQKAPLRSAAGLSARQSVCLAQERNTRDVA